MYSHPVSHINLLPTILEYMDIPIPKLLEGKSIMPVLHSVDAKVQDNIFIEFTRYEVDHDGFGGFQSMRTVFDGRYKLSVHLLDPIDELYDMEKDPYEMKNLINDSNYAEIRNKLHDNMLEWMYQTRDWIKAI